MSGQQKKNKNIQSCTLVAWSYHVIFFFRNKQTVQKSHTKNNYGRVLAECKMLLRNTRGYQCVCLHYHRCTPVVPGKIIQTKFSVLALYLRVNKLPKSIWYRLWQHYAEELEKKIKIIILPCIFFSWACQNVSSLSCVSLWVIRY